MADETDIVARLRALARAEHDDLSIADEAADLIASLRSGVPGAEPVAWIEFADNGNCRWFSTHKPSADLRRSEGAKLTPLYSSPQDKTVEGELREALEPTGKRRIYVASSWRCADHPRIVALLKDAGHEVYDFRNPKPGNKGFAWSEIDPEWLGWDPATFAKLLAHPVAQAGYALDKEALDWCDTCVLVLPCGRSAHLEAGYTAGQGKETIFYLSHDRFEPELMYLLGDGCVTTDDELLSTLTVRRAAAALRKGG